MRSLAARALVLTLVLACAVTGWTEVIDIDNDGLKRLLEQGVPVVDVRTAPEWRQTGVVAGSHLKTFFDARGRYDLRAWMVELARISGPDDPVVLICRTGNRTQMIARFLDGQGGYKRVYNVRLGIQYWIRAGNPTKAPAETASGSK